jgi:hypothetical protein
MSRNQWTVWSALIVAVAVGFFVFYGGLPSTQDKKERARNGNPSLDSSTTGDPEGKSEGEAIVGLKKNAPPSSKDPGSAAYWKDDEVTRAAKEVLMPVLVKVETKNAKALFSRSFGGHEITGIAVSAPTAEDIGGISVAMTAALEKVPPARKSEIQVKLQALYNQYTAFKGQYQVIYASRLENGKLSVTVEELKNLDDVLPAEDGTINHPTLGSRTFTSEESWRARYGHLLKDPEQPK